jgi:hypothetical protein
MWHTASPAGIYGFFGEKKNINFYFWTKHARVKILPSAK